MSSAPAHAGVLHRIGASAEHHPLLFDGGPSCRRFVSRPGRSSSPPRGCGRSTRTRSSPTGVSPCREEESMTHHPLDGGPRLHRDLSARQRPGSSRLGALSRC